MPEIHKWNSDGEATAYMQCGYCEPGKMKYMGVKNEKGEHLHRCVECDKSAYYMHEYPYRDPVFDR
ncbi:hypothetical protein NVI2019_GHJFPKLH_01367 [Providencia alcalifaciens]|nr:hypothetical protein NVI2019_GHJFPKLH_01367 [Providencia alcalifaciens]